MCLFENLEFILRFSVDSWFVFELGLTLYYSLKFSINLGKIN